jgi:hypothetical protein
LILPLAQARTPGSYHCTYNLHTTSQQADAKQARHPLTPPRQ